MFLTFLGIVLFLLAVLSIVFYRQLLKLNQNANSSLSEIEENLSLQAELITSLNNFLKREIEDSDEIIENFTNSQKEILYANTVEDLALSDKHFVEYLFSLMADKKTKSVFSTSAEFQKIVIKLLSLEKKLQYARKQYNYDISLVNKKIDSFPIKYLNKVFKGFTSRPQYEFGYQERTKVKKLLKLDYE